MVGGETWFMWFTMNLAKKGEEWYLRNIIIDVLGYVPVCEGQQLERTQGCCLGISLGSLIELFSVLSAI